MAAARKKKLGTFEGREVVTTGIKIRKTGDGLSEAMEAEPKLISQGETIYVVMECRCIDVEFPAEDRKNPELGGVRRIHVLDAGTATFLDEGTVGAAIREQAEKNELHAEKVAGIARLGLDTEDGMRGDHILGGHAEPVEGCQLCEDEA